MNIDISKLKELINLINSSNLTALEVQEGSLKIRLEKSDKAVEIPVQSSKNDASPYSGNGNLSLCPESKDALSAPESSQQETKSSEEEVNYKVIKAPMVGAFHNLPSADIGPGTKLKKGDSVCIIEAMKLMNEITMEEDGEIVSIEVSEGEMVEYGQVLVKYK